MQAQKEIRQDQRVARAEVGARAQAVRQEVAANPKYHMEVNKNSMNMAFQTKRLNELWVEGWKLHTAFEQNGNSVFVFERR